MKEGTIRKRRDKAMERFSIIKGDIVRMKTQAIVNAANTSLLGGGGVDGAIHRAAGGELLRECETLGGCKTGEAKITSGYRLKAEYVIHTPGPIWRGGKWNERELLANCYRNSLRLAKENAITSISFPSISTGVYHFPIEDAARIAISEILFFLKENPDFEQVIFVCFDDKTYKIYEKVYKEFQKREEPLKEPKKEVKKEAKKEPKKETKKETR